MRRILLSAIASLCFAVPGHAQELASPTDAAIQSSPSDQTLNGIAAVVNDEMISMIDVQQRALLLLIGRNIPPTPEALEQAQPVAIEQLIDERLKLQKAEEFELEIEAEAIEGSIGEIASASGITVPELYDSLQQAGVDPLALEAQTRADIAWRRIMSGLYGSRIRISQVQIDDMLERMESQAKKPSYQLSEIFIFAPTEEDKAQVINNAAGLVDQIQTGAPFQLVAQRFSQAPTAAVGGDMGWVSPDELPVEAQNVLASLTPPALTDPIVAADGIYIYAFRNRQEAQASSGSDVILTQVVQTDGGRNRLRSVRSNAENCAQIADVTEDFDNVIVADLGRVAEATLTDDIRAVVSSTATGTASEIFMTDAGNAIVFVCDRASSGVVLPERDQVEDRLYGQQISMISDRELRDLRREATIIRR